MGAHAAVPSVNMAGWSEMLLSASSMVASSTFPVARIRGALLEEFDVLRVLQIDVEPFQIRDAAQGLLVELHQD